MINYQVFADTKWVSQNFGFLIVALCWYIEVLMHTLFHIKYNF